MNISVRAALIAGLVGVTTAGGQQGLPAGFQDEHVASVPFPTALASTPDGRLLVASQYGQLFIVQNDLLIEEPALDLGDEVCVHRERGLTGIAVDPDFASNKFLYLAYIANTSGQCEGEYANAPTGRVSRFRLDDDNSIARDSEHVLIDNIRSPIGVHNLDDVEFGPDGYLYVSIGDGGCDYAGDSGCFDSNDAAGDRNVLNGKVLRITRDGDIPPDNPFVGPDSVRCSAIGVAPPGQVCQEIYAIGLRNPWRLAFDPNATGTRLFINDVGQDTWEEINEAAAGADYGWNTREGYCANGSTTDCDPAPPPGLTNPIHAYGRDEGCASITGGAFVPRGIWPAGFDGVYLFSDYVCGSIFALSPDGAGSYVRETFLSGLGDSSATDLLFGWAATPTGLYYTTYARGGEVRRIVHTGSANRRPSAVVSATPGFGQPPLTVTFDASGSSDPDGDELTYSWTFGDGSITETGIIVEHTYAAVGSYTVTLRVTDPAGGEAIATTRIDVGNTPPVPEILSPSAANTFAVGDTIVLLGRADDSEDGDLPDSALSWRVVLHHNTHTHGFVPQTRGSTVSFQAPGPENLEAAATSYLEIQLTATDAGGLSTTIVQPLRPQMVELTFDSTPAGVRLRIDNADVTTPATFLSWANFGVRVEAGSQSGSGGVALAFAGWSDGGAAAHTLITPASTTTYTAYFTQSPTAGGVYASSVEAPGFEADKAIDGDPETRWSSAFSDPQWLMLDFGVRRQIDRIVLQWEVAYARAYQLEVSDDGGTWATVYATESGDGGVDVVDTPGVVARFLRVFGTARGTQWGYSLYEIQVSDAGTGTAVPIGNSAIALPGVIEAEDFDSGGAAVAYFDTSTGNQGGQYRETDVDLEQTSDTGGGFNVGWIAADEWLTYTVDVAAAGLYTLTFRVASYGEGGTFHLEIDGRDTTGLLTIPDTGGWQSWVTIGPLQIDVPGGRQVWRLVMDAAGPSGAVGNFNWFSVTPPSSSVTPVALSRAPYLQQVTDESAIIVWATREPAAAAVRYGASGGFVTVPAITRHFSAAETGLAEGYSQHEVRLGGLTAATRYAYELLADGTAVPDTQAAFTTAAPPGTGTARFIAFGDSGVGSDAQRSLAAQMAVESFDLAIHTGDLAYGTAAGAGSGSYPQYEDWVFGVYESWLRERPFYPSIGNHDDEIDAARAYRDVFALPVNGGTATFPDHAERYYSFDYGPVHFVALDTETAFIDPQRREAQLAWLEADLAATSQPWRVVYFHKPPYSAGTHHGSNFEVRNAFVPIFERYGVQLVVTGHEHLYERTIPLREYVAGGAGVTYVVSGGGGTSLYPTGLGYWTASTASVHHYVRFAADACTLTLEAIAVGGDVFDSFQIDRCQ